jgi:carboxymethylenebutenolidase
MIDSELDVVTPDGAMNTFMTRPDEGGPHPVVLFLMDAPGKREELHDMARRIGTCGYSVLLPNLYYRTARHFDATPDLTGRANEVREMIATLNLDTLRTDVEALLAHADDDLAMISNAVGVVGYCMSGPFAYAAAGMFPNRISAAASIYGVRLHGPGSPQHLASAIRCEMYFACAELDEYVPPDMIDDLERHLHAHAIAARVERYPGVRHGFAFPSRRDAYDKLACERHFERLIDLFGRNLRT